jgi:exonuclease III
MKAGAGHTMRRLELLKSIEWDVLALQEVSPAAWTVLANSQLAEHAYYSLQTFNSTPNGQQPHGVALLARSGLQLSHPELIPGLSKPERGIAARLVGLHIVVTVARWHAPNAAGEGVAVKMQGYRGITNWLNAKDASLILGLDGNHWNPSVELAPPPIPIDTNRWLPEVQFYAGNRSHRLYDTYLAYLRQNPQVYADVLRQRPNGAVAISYVRGPKTETHCGSIRLYLCHRRHSHHRVFLSL